MGFRAVAEENDFVYANNAYLFDRVCVCVCVGASHERAQYRLCRDVCIVSAKEKNARVNINHVCPLRTTAIRALNRTNVITSDYAINNFAARSEATFFTHSRLS